MLAPSGWIPPGRATSPCNSPACDSATRSAARAAGGERCASAACSGRPIFPPSLASSLSRCQGMSGEAALPSTVDLYVDNALRMSREVPSGPFSIQDLPVTTGQGDARLVVRDILGREQVITQPFYATPRLLRQGLHDYSYELGFVRRNFGTDSNNYGRALAVGSHRLGITEQFTGEIHGELLGHQQTLGLGGVLLWPARGRTVRRPRREPQR